jgi:hypothetical protein
MSNCCCCPLATLLKWLCTIAIAIYIAGTFVPLAVGFYASPSNVTDHELSKTTESVLLTFFKAFEASLINGTSSNVTLTD